MNHFHTCVGTIVAIEDVFQHMYIAVENSESRNNLVGTMHYSLVGERSLFKVQHYCSVGSLFAVSLRGKKKLLLQLLFIQNFLFYFIF